MNYAGPVLFYLSMVSTSFAQSTVQPVEEAKNKLDSCLETLIASTSEVAESAKGDGSIRATSNLHQHQTNLTELVRLFPEVMKLATRERYEQGIRLGNDFSREIDQLYKDYYYFKFNVSLGGSLPSGCWTEQDNWKAALVAEIEAATGAPAPVISKSESLQRGARVPPTGIGVGLKSGSIPIKVKTKN